MSSKEEIRAHLEALHASLQSFAELLTKAYDALEDIDTNRHALVVAVEGLPDPEPEVPPEVPPEQPPFSVHFSRPAEGGILRGNVEGPESETPIELVGEGIVRAEFYLDGEFTNRDGNPANGFGPWFDTRQYPNGEHVVRAVATNSAGDQAEATIRVVFDNRKEAPSLAVFDDDILNDLNAALDPEDMGQFSVTGVGRHVSPRDLPLRASDGSNRIAVIQDPHVPSKRVWEITLRKGDPNTSGSPRTEFQCPKVIEMNGVYWVGFSLFMLTPPDGFPGIFGTQCHAGDTSKGFSPSIALIYAPHNDFRRARMRCLHVAREGASHRYEDQPLFDIKIGQWMDFVIQFRHNLAGDGFCRMWIDGEQNCDFRGNLGFYTTSAIRDYMKFGTYHWAGLAEERKMLLRRPCLVRDPGGRYSPETIREFVNA